MAVLGARSLCLKNQAVSNAKAVWVAVKELKLHVQESRKPDYLLSIHVLWYFELSLSTAAQLLDPTGLSLSRPHGIEHEFWRPGVIESQQAWRRNGSSSTSEIE